MDEWQSATVCASRLQKKDIRRALDLARLIFPGFDAPDYSQQGLLFVKKQYHRQGIARRLFQLVLRHCGSDTITVNPSPCAAGTYRRLGFVATGGEKTVNGIRFTPIEYRQRA